MLASEGLRGFVLAISGLDKFPLRAGSGPHAWRAASRMKTFVSAYFWSTFACILSLMFLNRSSTSSIEDAQGIGSHFLNFHICIYAFCVASRTAMRVWPESASRVLDILIELLHLAMILGQITTPSHIALIFSGCSKIARCWLCINVADRRRVVVWNVLLGIGGIWRNTQAMNETDQSGQQPVSDHYVQESQVAVVGTELLCCIVCVLISGAIDDLFSGYESAFTAELASNEHGEEDAIRYSGK
ncbi:unnamed protein product [Polarella glacialis]|uniref:Uncharacterized protein n=1 Tax=Polarella glacialis TaxID=89957 RepID=A0A813FY14_POLGL|nr:unnamed protein product [Polarella glacialis]